MLIGLNSFFSPLESIIQSWVAKSSSLNKTIEFLSSEKVTFLLFKLFLLSFELLFAFSKAFFFISSNIASLSSSES